MPELPEVENVRRNLETLVVGKTIESVEVRLPRIIRTPDDTVRFALELSGRTITGVGRRGKYLLFSVPPYTLISHLRMEGRYGLSHKGDPIEPHTHVIFHFTDGDELRYRDVRQFGTMDLVTSELDFPAGFQKLGPEPLDESFTAADFFQRLHSRKAPVKALLLDQSCIAGLGNIYVDESLFLSHIHPERIGCSLTESEVSLLLEQIRAVIQKAIAAGGSSIRSYVDGYGRHGGFQMELNVYGRAGQACVTCGSQIEKIRVAGRGTHFCRVCQQLDVPDLSNVPKISRTAAAAKAAKAAKAANGQGVIKGGSSA
jgi:formamidopyrimidine-DNA glycosylase